MYLVKRISDNELYALKKVSKPSLRLSIGQVKMGKLTEKEKENALNEVRILASIQ